MSLAVLISFAAGLLLTNVVSVVLFLMLKKQLRVKSFVSKTMTAVTEKKPCQCSGMADVLQKSIEDHLGQIAGWKTDMMSQFSGVKAQLKSILSSSHVRADTLETEVRKNMEQLKTNLQTLTKPTLVKPASPSSALPGRMGSPDVANLCRSVMKNQERLITAIDKLTRIKTPPVSKIPPKASRR